MSDIFISFYLSFTSFHRFFFFFFRVSGGAAVEKVGVWRLAWMR